jgi:hypothetical protein
MDYELNLCQNKERPASVQSQTNIIADNNENCRFGSLKYISGIISCSSAAVLMVSS